MDLRVSIPDRDYGFLKRPLGRDGAASQSVSIPDRDYGFLKPANQIKQLMRCSVSIPDRDYGFLKLHIRVGSPRADG